MLTDMSGKTITLGDTVAYPGRVGRSMRNEMVIGKLIGLKLGYRSSYDYRERKRNYREEVHAKIRTTNRAVTGPSVYNTVVTIMNTHNIIKIED